MSAAKKYQQMFRNSDEESAHQKKEIEAYQKKIEQLMRDPKMQKKAALILEQMILKGSK